jgi:hypothetical protein
MLTMVGGKVVYEAKNIERKTQPTALLYAVRNSRSAVHSGWSIMRA